MATKKSAKKTSTKKKATARKIHVTAAESPAAMAAAPAGRTRWLAMSTEQLQEMYKEVVGRETSSQDRRYLIWKIREAKAGRVRVGPSSKRPGMTDPFVMSVRVEKETVPVLDEIWPRHGYASRNHLVQRAIGRELAAIGEDDAAARFADAQHEGE